MSSYRPNWYNDHPPACTCVRCAQARLSKKSFGQRLKALWPFGKKDKGSRK